MIGPDGGEREAHLPAKRWHLTGVARPIQKGQIALRLIRGPRGGFTTGFQGAQCLPEASLATLQHFRRCTVERASVWHRLFHRKKDEVEIALEYIAQSFEINRRLQVVLVIHRGPGKGRC